MWSDEFINIHYKILHWLHQSGSAISGTPNPLITIFPIQLASSFGVWLICRYQSHMEHRYITRFGDLKNEVPTPMIPNRPSEWEKWWGKNPRAFSHNWEIQDRPTLPIRRGPNFLCSLLQRVLDRRTTKWLRMHWDWQLGETQENKAAVELQQSSLRIQHFRSPFSPGPQRIPRIRTEYPISQNPQFGTPIKIIAQAGLWSDLQNPKFLVGKHGSGSTRIHQPEQFGRFRIVTHYIHHSSDLVLWSSYHLLIFMVFYV
jgi:hypothetical protein